MDIIRSWKSLNENKKEYVEIQNSKVVGKIGEVKGPVRRKGYHPIREVCQLYPANYSEPMIIAATAAQIPSVLDVRRPAAALVMSISCPTISGLYRGGVELSTAPSQQ